MNKLNEFFKKINKEREPEIRALRIGREKRQAALKKMKPGRKYYYETDVPFGQANHPGEL